MTRFIGGSVILKIWRQGRNSITLARQAQQTKNVDAPKIDQNRPIQLIIHPKHPAILAVPVGLFLNKTVFLRSFGFQSESLEYQYLQCKKQKKGCACVGAPLLCFVWKRPYQYNQSRLSTNAFTSSFKSKTFNSQYDKGLRLTIPIGDS